MAFIARFLSRGLEWIVGSRPVVEEDIPSVQRDTCYPNGTKKGCIISYYDKGQGRVDIPETLNPWQVLDLHSFHVPSRMEIEAAFKVRIRQSVRQNSAMASVAYHMLTSPGSRYVQKCDSDEFVITTSDHFVLAACGHTKALLSKIWNRRYLLEDKDERGQTLLYIASRSGFYDMCELLLEKGASINAMQSTGSTPLHGAACYGHTLIVGLLLQHGAKTDIKNQFGRTTLDESVTPEVRILIQTASADKILSLTAELKGKNLVHRVQLIKYQGEVIAKELERDQSTLDEASRAQWNDICRKWESAWHGTRYGYLESILMNGLLPGAGSSGIQLEADLYEPNEENLDVSDWAAAIFLTPSILYASQEVYSERVFSESQLWYVLVKAYCKPGSYKPYNPQIPLPLKDFRILRVESAHDVVVYSLMFVRCSFLENKHMNVDEKMRILGQEKKSSSSCSVS